MTRKHINPENTYQSIPFGLSNAVERNGGHTLYPSRQVARSAKVEIVDARDLIAQVIQALEKLRAVLAAVGATRANVVRLRTYVVGQ